MEGGVLSEVANGNRLDILYYVFMVYADNYIHINSEGKYRSRDEYKKSIKQQIDSFGKTVKLNLPKNKRKEIEKLLKQ